jgi:DNA primase
MPISWDQLDSLVLGEHTIHNAIELRRRSADPWRGFDAMAVDLKAVLRL